MPTSNYYQTLNIAPNATAAEIRKAYRQLVLQHHPDRNGGSKTAELNFIAIQQAYFTLSNQTRRLAYNLQANIVFCQNSQPKNVTDIVAECKNLEQRAASLDVYRMDKAAWQAAILHVLKNENINLIVAQHNHLTNHQIIQCILRCCVPLSYPFLKKISAQLLLIAGSNTATINSINQQLKNEEWQWYWHKYNGIIILLITIFICFFILFSNGSH